MQSRRRRAQSRAFASEKHELQMTPMIDVTFLLLIFFICTLRFKTLEGVLAADLPHALGVNNGLSEQDTSVTIGVRVVETGTLVRPDGSAYTDADLAARRRFVYDASRRIETTLGATRTTELREVGVALRHLHAAQADRRIKLDSHAGVTNGEVVEVLDLVTEVGFTDIVFVGSRED